MRLPVQFCNSITAKVLVWLAGVLVPAQTMPLMACACGSQSQGSAKLESGRVDAASAATCPHCTGRSPVRRSCCASATARSARHGTSCGAKGSCSCGGQDGARSPGGSCQCSKSRSAPAPVPASNGSRTDNTKSSSASSVYGPTTVAIVAAPAALAHAHQQPTLLGSSAPERLSLLCRLVI